MTSEFSASDMPAPEIDWGDIDRRDPFCEAFGISRGGPVDRVYTDTFRTACHRYVHGRCLEIGPLPNQRDPVTANASEYRTLDRRERPDINLTGELTDPSLVPDRSFNTVVAFHVLEHTADPQAAADQIFRILRPDGYALVCCPVIQRLHGTPHDYWRPMPKGLQFLFRRYSTVELFTYGNLQTSIAALAGIGAPELSPDIFEFHDPRYPVLTGIIAKK